MKNSLYNTTEKIRQSALALGFDACGFAQANRLEEDAARLTKWLNEKMHSGMHYMENHFEKRVDPRLLVEKAKTVIVVLLNYFPETSQPEANNFILSKYAYGTDYHQVMKSKLKALQKDIEDNIAPVKGRVFVDSAPVLERAWAAAAGLGWIGKNSLLISPKSGSFFFIGELIVNIELSYDKPITDFCGSCTKCIHACPTNAIIEPRVIDSNLCISYWTIEQKEDISPGLKGKFQNRIFGCDICQDVCPWNLKSSAGDTPEFRPHPDLLSMAKNDWQNLSEEKYNEIFSKSAVNRTSFRGLKRNIRFVGDENI